MSAEEIRHQESTRDSKFIVFLQCILPVSFTCAMLGIVVWILSLLLLSRKLSDTFSASIGISIVAIPVFLILLSVMWYVFLGIIRNQDDEEPRAAEPEDGAAGSAPARSEGADE